jgi:hypothetical protein
MKILHVLSFYAAVFIKLLTSNELILRASRR